MFSKSKIKEHKAWYRIEYGIEGICQCHKVVPPLT